MMKVLVTGAIGYIGSHTIVELCNANYEPVLLDNLSNTNLSVLNNLEILCNRKLKFYKADVRDLNSLRDIFINEQNINTIIHFAAKKAVNESINNPLDYYDNNISGLINVLKCAEEFNIEHFIFSSSCTVYGEPDSLPVDENMPRKISLSPYGNTKRIGEELIEEFIKFKNSFKAIILRYFNPVGAHESALIGELPNGIPNNLMPFITQTAIGIREELKVFGNDYNTPDGTCIRDFIHVSDLANAHVKAIEYSNLMNSKIDYFNVGTGNGFSVLELIQNFENKNNVKLNYTITRRREGDIEQIFSNTQKINKTMKWFPKYSLEDMVSSSWNWELFLNKTQ